MAATNGGRSVYVYAKNSKLYIAVHVKMAGILLTHAL